MVLSVPGPNKGAVILACAAEEVTRFTISLHGEEAIILQSDGEPAIKAVVRAVAAARSKLGRKTTQRTTPVGAHQSNGGAECAVQTVRRLGTCLFHALEVKAGTFPADTPLKLWAQVHFLYNRPSDPPRAGLWRDEHHLRHQPSDDPLWSHPEREREVTAAQVEELCIAGWPWNKDHVEPLGAPAGHPLLYQTRTLRQRR